MEKRLGVIITVEALLATLLLFGLLLIVFKLSNLDEGDNQEQKILRSKAQQIQLVLKNTGSIDEILSDDEDTKIRELMDGMPAGICSQVEIFEESISKTDLHYSYRSTDCQIYSRTPISSSIMMHAHRTARHSITYYFVRVSTYAKG